MGRMVTRRTSNRQAGSAAREVSTSEHQLSATSSGRVSKRRKKMSIPKKEELSVNLDDSVLSLSLDETNCSEGSFSPEAPSCSKQRSTIVPEPSDCSKELSSGAPEDNSEKDCSICLQKALQPVKLPCSHVFCYLCIKGVVHSSVATCALCRAPIPRGYLFNPEVLEESTSEEDETTQCKWYYEGRSGGWWEYDQRTTTEIERGFSDTDSPRQMEMMIAGYIYIIDLDAMVQKRKVSQHIQRRIKRDTAKISDKKGVAGIIDKRNRRGDTRTDRYTYRRTDAPNTNPGQIGRDTSPGDSGTAV